MIGTWWNVIYDRNVVEYDLQSDFPCDGNTLDKHRWSLMEVVEHLQVATFQVIRGKFLDHFPPFGNRGNEP